MARILILSSYVASSRVGGGAQALALARLGIEPILIPTVLFGRHPGYGAPGGAAVAAETIEAMLGGVEAQGLFAELDAVITGHFSTPDQVAVAASAIDRIKAAGSATRIIVDPIMGDDDKGLYVREPVADAIAGSLIQRADLLAPNAWELARLSGQPVTDLASALAAARSLERPVVASSVRSASDIGVVYADADQAWLASHPSQAAAPRGTGDLLTALFAAALTLGVAPDEALRQSVGGVADAVVAAAGLDELPVTALPSRLAPSERVRLLPL